MRPLNRQRPASLLALALILIHPAAEAQDKAGDRHDAGPEGRVREELERLEARLGRHARAGGGREMAEVVDAARIQAADQLARSVAKGDDTRYLLAFRAALDFAEGLEDRLAAGGHHRDGVQPQASGIESDPVYIENAKRLIREQQRTQRIIGGVVTGSEEFADCVAVGNESEWCCSGTLVAPNVVVTAGHCAARCARRVFVGADVEQEGEIIPVKEIVRHDGYAKGGLHNDLAVLVLERDVDSERATPRAIAPGPAIDSAFYVRLVGYGTNDAMGSKGYGIRRKADVALATADCRQTAGAHARYGCDPGLEFVAGAPFLGKDTCPGDSGGPVYVLYEGRWLLAGATSRMTRESAESDVGCGDGGIYVRLDKYAAWIRSVKGGHWPAQGAVAGTSEEEDPDGAQGTAAEGATRHALLVGVTNYTNPAIPPLSGPGTDVVLMRRLLTTKLQFPDGTIVTLSEEESKKDPKRAPSRANIEAELNRLAALAGRGHRIVVYLSGHGSRQPDLIRPDPKPDGLSEIFLPSDTGRWDDQARRVENALLDSELRDRLGAIQAKGALVWAIIDSCHSGTIARGADDVGLRVIANPKRAFSIPDRAYSEAVDRIDPARGQADLAFTPIAQRGLVALYAALPDEVTFETPLPYKAPPGDQVTYGVLTWFLNEVFHDVANDPGPDITYDELALRINQKFNRWGLTYPHATVEGYDRDRLVLGMRRRRTAILLSKADQGPWTIDAGRLHGLNLDTVLAVYPGKKPAQDKPAGYVKIVEPPGPVKSIVEPFEYKGVKPPSGFDEGSFCEPVFITFGELKLRVAAAETTPDGAAVAPEAVAGLKARLTRIQDEPNSVITLVDPARADWLIRPDGRSVVMTRKEGMKYPLRLDAGSAATDEMEVRLREVARAELLKQLATPQPSRRSVEEGRALVFDVDLLQFPTPGGAGVPVPWSEAGVVLRPGTEIALRMVNRGSHPTDVTVLHIDEGYGIKAVFPGTPYSSRNRLKAPPEMKPVYTDHFRVKANGEGVHYFLVFGLKGEGLAANFNGLEQASLARARAVSRGELVEHDFWRLIEAVYGVTRDARDPGSGLEKVKFDDFVVRVYRWDIHP
jgi:hypothetical protein